MHQEPFERLRNLSAKKRKTIQTFIQTSYSHWEKVDASNPVESAKSILEIIKEHPKCKPYHLIFSCLLTMIQQNGNQETLNKVCHDVQKLIAYAISYVHKKRQPTVNTEAANGSTSFKYRSKYCEYVDVAKWAERYSIPL